MKARLGGQEIELPYYLRLKYVDTSMHPKTGKTAAPAGVAGRAGDMGRRPAQPHAIHFSLAGQLPGGKNAINITRTGHRYPNKRFVAWRTIAMQQIPKASRLLQGPVRMVVWYTPGDRRVRDVPGMMDALLHVIERVGLVENDGQIQEVEWEQQPVLKGAPSCDVTLVERTPS